MDKVDTYDKEQLQAMGWLFDETETPDTAVRFVEQDLTSEQQMQVFKNLSWNVYVTDSKSFLGSTLTPEEIERFKVTSAIILTDLNKIFLYGAQSGDYIRFYGMVNNDQFGGININPSTGLVTGVGSYRFLDVESVHFTKQTLTIPQQNQALGNIGIDFVRLQYSLLNTTLSDEMMEVVDNARGIILVDTPSNYSGPTVFVKGNNASGSCIFVSFVTGNTYSILTLNKSTKLLSGISSGLTYAGSVRYAEKQSLTTSEQNQALENIGADLMVIDLVNGQATLTDEQEARLLSSKGVILRGTTSSPEALSHIFHGDLQTGNVVGFYSFRKNDYCMTCQYTKSTRTFKVIGNTALRDNSAVVFDRGQSLTTSQQAQARANIGVQSAAELLADDDFIAQLKTKLGL